MIIHSSHFITDLLKVLSGYKPQTEMSTPIQVIPAHIVLENPTLCFFKNFILGLRVSHSVRGGGQIPYENPALL